MANPTVDFEDRITVPPNGIIPAGAYLMAQTGSANIQILALAAYPNYTNGQFFVSDGVNWQNMSGTASVTLAKVSF